MTLCSLHYVHNLCMLQHTQQKHMFAAIDKKLYAANDKKLYDTKIPLHCCSQLMHSILKNIFACCIMESTGVLCTRTNMHDAQCTGIARRTLEGKTGRQQWFFAVSQFMGSNTGLAKLPGMACTRAGDLHCRSH